MSRRYEHSDNREREISTTKGVLVGGEVSVSRTPLYGTHGLVS